MIAVTVAIVVVGVAGTVALGVQAVRWQSPRRERGKRWRCGCYWRRDHAVALAAVLAAVLSLAAVTDTRAPLHSAHHCRAETVGDTFRRECEWRQGDRVVITEWTRTSYTVR